MASSTDFKPDREVMLTDSFEIGSKGACDYCIDDDQVTDLHAVITRKMGRSTIRDRGSRTGTLVNNRSITEVGLQAGDWISIGPTMFQFLDDRLAVYPRGRMYRIDGSDLKRSVMLTPETGGIPIPLVLIDDVTITVEPGEFTAIIGPSGSGKSTLLNALSARVPADAGSVDVNGKDLISHFDELKRSIVLVPQRETIHEPLTVRAILTHTARLRMPPGTSRQALVREVNRVLGVVDLPEEQHRSAFNKLSGGQKKRVCLANELIGNPQIIFLDEVTSGLDEEADGRMMALFRKLADGGKTVIGITHNLANVERFCHRVIVLANGGRLVFTGSAAETKAYFQVPQLGDVYRRLEQDEPADVPPTTPGDVHGALTGKAAKAEAWRLAYERQQRRIRDRAAIAARKSGRATASPSGIPDGRPDEESPFRRTVSQTAALILRYTDLQLADRYNLISMAGTSILVAVLLLIVFGNVSVGSESGLFKPAAHDGPMLLFLVLLSCMWFGCNAAAKEVIKEADIYRMERNHSLDLTAYYLSKLSVLSVLSLTQAALLYLPVKVICQPDGAFVPQVITVAGVTLVGVTLGLVVSSVAKTVDGAATLVPIVVIPQFVLAGAVTAVSGFAKFLAIGAALYWGYKGILASEPNFFERVIEIPSWFPAHLMLFIHGCAYLAGGWFLLRMKDKGQTTADLIRLTRLAMSDPNGPASRFLSTAKASLASVSHLRLPADSELSRGLSALPRLVRRPATVAVCPPPILPAQTVQAPGSDSASGQPPAPLTTPPATVRPPSTPPRTPAAAPSAAPGIGIRRSKPLAPPAQGGPPPVPQPPMNPRA